MGWQLDPAAKLAPDVPVLEDLFRDKDMYTLPTDTLATRKSPFVTPFSPFAESPRDIRGANVLFVQAFFRKMFLQSKVRLDVPDTLTLLYFPPWHPLAHGRKSRPALSVVSMGGAEYNGNKPAHRTKNSGPQRSRNPLSYAVWRQRTARMMRRLLFESWRTTPKSQDGYYLCIVRVVPTEEVARNAMVRFVEKAAASSHEWADKPTKAFSFAAMNKRLAAAKLAPVTPYLSRSDWL